ncbi:MAG: hypothetical protein CVU39_07160 [Chloroflexi bacterium HGW-Chloroflexi-10]|nr:MAG: hypothetical protein CVU39_07160 [Chloroflexi bacterium HGW-Chloroflexi-10]
MLLGICTPFVNNKGYSIDYTIKKRLFCEGLYSKLLDTIDHVAVVFPRAIGTNIAVNSGDMTPSSASNTKTTLKMTPPQVAADQILKGIENNNFRVLVGNDAKMMDFFYRQFGHIAVRR